MTIGVEIVGNSFTAVCEGVGNLCFLPINLLFQGDDAILRNCTQDVASRRTATQSLFSAVFKKRAVFWREKKEAPVLSEKKQLRKVLQRANVMFQRESCIT